MTDFGNNLLGLWLLNVFDVNTIAGHVRAATLSKTKNFFQNGLTKYHTSAIISRGFFKSIFHCGLLSQTIYVLNK